MNNPANPKCNAEGYNDPTAFMALTKSFGKNRKPNGEQMNLSRC